MGVRPELHPPSPGRPPAPQSPPQERSQRQGWAGQGHGSPRLRIWEVGAAGREAQGGEGGAREHRKPRAQNKRDFRYLQEGQKERGRLPAGSPKAQSRGAPEPAGKGH